MGLNENKFCPGEKRSTGPKKEYEDSSFTGLNSVLHPQREKGLHTKAY